MAGPGVDPLATELLVLAPDLLVTAVEDLAPAVRERLGGAGGYVLTRPAGRSASTFLDADAVALLREFGSPSKIVDAVIRYGRARAKDPESLLQGAFLLVRGCSQAGYLRFATGAAATRQAADRNPTRFVAGDEVAGGTVMHCVQALDDSELYRLSLPAGGFAALKVPRGSSPRSAEMYRRERAALTRLAGPGIAVAPRLLAVSHDPDDPWLAMEWCDGTPLRAAAGALRRAPTPRRRLVELGCRVVEAYARVHGQGVVHGDVHPGNVIVGPDSEVRIVDYGLSVLLDRTATDGEAVRGAVPRYTVPDQARAQLRGARAPGPSTSSDLYGVAALVYEICSGVGYLDFDLDREGLLRQIAEDRPQSFAARGLPAWPEVEGPVLRALSKDSADRQASVAGFGLQLAVARAAEPAGPPSYGRGRGAGVVDGLLDSVLATVRPGGAWFEDGPPGRPVCSIAYGSAGVAVALHHVATRQDDPELAVLADEWALRARAQARGPEAFENPAIELTAAVTGPVTPFHRMSGIEAVQALVSHSLNDVVARARAVEAYVGEGRQDGDSLDLVLGRTGYLLGAAILHEELQGARHLDRAGLRAAGDRALTVTWARVDASPPVAEDRQHRSLGIAHGWAGLLYTALRWSRTTGAPPPGGLEERLEQLAALAVPTGPGGRSGVRWPWANNESRTLAGWCNGSAGHVHLWLLAHERFGDERWLSLAERAGRDAYLSPGVPQLCCGLAGQAYALLELHRQTGDRTWLTGATELAVKAAAGSRDDGGGPRGALVAGSLHKGELGVAVLAADLARPHQAAMPFFGIQR